MTHFNVKTGEFFEPLPTETMTFFHLPILPTFKRNCSKCNGKFHRGFNTSKNEFILCDHCVKTYMDHSKYNGGRHQKEIQSTQ